MLPIHAPLRSTILSEVAKNRESPIPQPIVIIGASGSGKTTLLKQLSEALLKADQKTLWIDGRYIFSSDKITDLINQTSPNVIIIDDLDYYFSRCDYNEQYSLRRQLYNEGAPMLIGSVTKVMPAMTDYKAPFF